MIVVTGAEGFIGSCLVERLNREGKEHLLLVDDFSPDVEGVVAIVGKKVLVREGVLADDAGDDDGGDGDADVVVPHELG